MIDMFFEQILKFLNVHAKFIIGVVINIILIWGISSIIKSSNSIFITCGIFAKLWL